MSYLEFEHLTKTFPGVRALEDVSFGVDEGSVHAVCGENGAGKSTLLKILSGVYCPDSGSVKVGGKTVSFATPFEAIRGGVAVIYQELHLVPEMTVAENVFLGHLPQKAGILDRHGLVQSASKIFGSLGVDIDVKARVGALPLAQRQMVEIAKAMSLDAKVIAFDEPTSSLSSREVDHLFALISDLKRQGRVILYVSHRMAEIFAICDKATILRDGRHVETFGDLRNIGESEIVTRMVGRSINDIYGYRGRKIGGERLSISNLEAEGLRGPASLTVGTGEIVGIFGLVGAGRTELLQAIYGAVKKTGGVEIDGKAANTAAPPASIKSGLALSPEDRKKDGIFPLRSVSENINISSRKQFAIGGFWISEIRDKQNAEKQVGRLRIKAPSLGQPVGLLSGGNQQKAILGRWLSDNVKVLMLDEPTRGIDVGAKREIYEIMYELAEQGVGILFVSSEMPEVLGVSDRILVMRQGQIVANLKRSDATEEKLLRLALPTSVGVA
ncbi:MAG TPA: L-arabinose ABC transporter ATP-binding protein AraG [Fimbriimonadales bacterium]|nr:L-arabinose ABC transporter ATP-binding protein AraG [Fimbriimonadales bacterium]